MKIKVLGEQPNQTEKSSESTQLRDDQSRILTKSHNAPQHIMHEACNTSKMHYTNSWYQPYSKHKDK